MKKIDQLFRIAWNFDQKGSFAESDAVMIKLADFVGLEGYKYKMMEALHQIAENFPGNESSLALLEQQIQFAKSKPELEALFDKIANMQKGIFPDTPDIPESSEEDADFMENLRVVFMGLAEESGLAKTIDTLKPIDHEGFKILSSLVLNAAKHAFHLIVSGKKAEYEELVRGIPEMWIPVQVTRGRDTHPIVAEVASRAEDMLGQVLKDLGAQLGYYQADEEDY